MRIAKIAITSHEKVLYINTYDIVYFQSEGSFVTITLLDGRKHIVYKPLTKLQSLLPAFFVRVTQCIIINKLYLDWIDKKDKIIRMQGDIEIKYTLKTGNLIGRIGEIATETSDLSAISEREDNVAYLDIPDFKAYQ